MYKKPMTQIVYYLNFNDHTMVKFTNKDYYKILLKDSSTNYLEIFKHSFSFLI